MEMPLYWRVSAGFPSPADDYREPPLDLNELVLVHRETTFFVQVRGDSMIGEHIRDGDYLAVDRAVTPEHGDIIVAKLGNRFTIKTYCQQGNDLFLVPANPLSHPIPITKDMDFEVWGVVRAFFHLLLPRSR